MNPEHNPHLGHEPVTPEEKFRGLAEEFVAESSLTDWNPEVLEQLTGYLASTLFTIDSKCKGNWRNVRAIGETRFSSGPVNYVNIYFGRDNMDAPVYTSEDLSKQDFAQNMSSTDKRKIHTLLKNSIGTLNGERKKPSGNPRSLSIHRPSNGKSTNGGPQPRKF